VLIADILPPGTSVCRVDFWSPNGSPDSVVAQARAWLDGPDDVDLVVATSGSTGQPKRVRVPRAAVLASVRASAARLGASGPWVLALPPSYVAGVQVVVRSLVAGHEPTLLERDGWPAGDGWFVSLVPTQLTRMLSSQADVEALRRAHTVLLGGGPIGASLRSRAEDAGVRVVATYGSAETAGGCVYDGMPLDGVAVALGESGRIRIAGPTLFTGYDGRPELTAEVLTGGWFLTSDAGRLDEDGRLVVIGRVDDVIVTGGLNVPGPAVAERLRGHAGVSAAEVLGVPDPEWGNRVVAFVVGAVELDDLRDWVSAAHPRAWAPRQLVRLDAIPLLDNGKPDRQALLALVEAAR
jgi:O-succinylbenzoic acid--CoA ligase